MTAMAGSTKAWHGERGHIDPAMLRRHLYEDDIRTEEFTGY